MNKPGFTEIIDRLYNKALKFLSYRPRSEKEIKDYLKRKIKKKEAQPEDWLLESVVKRLKKQNFLDDKYFVKWWIEQRAKFKPRSLRLIKIELEQKGISRELIESIIKASQSKIIDDLELAKKLIEKKKNKWNDLAREKKFQKAARYLSSKGFDYDIIKEVFKQI